MKRRLRVLLLCLALSIVVAATALGTPFLAVDSYGDIVKRVSTYVLGIYNSTNQMALQIYNTYTDASNYERTTYTGLAGNSGNVTMQTAGTGADNLHLVLSGAGTGSVKLRGPSWSRTTTKTVSTTPVTLTTEEVCNAMVLVTTGAGVINMPPKAATLDGCITKFWAIAKTVFSVNPDSSDIMVLGGTALTGGNQITSDNATDNQISVMYDATATRWRAFGVSGIFSDGG